MVSVCVPVVAQAGRANKCLSDHLIGKGLVLLKPYQPSAHARGGGKLGNNFLCMCMCMCVSVAVLAIYVHVPASCRLNIYGL